MFVHGLQYAEPDFRIPDHPTITNIVSSRFELRLHQENEVTLRGRTAAKRPDGQPKRDEREVGCGQVGEVWKLFGPKIPHIFPLEHCDSLILPQAPVELTVPHVDGNDVRGSSLKETVDEATGG